MPSIKVALIQHLKRPVIEDLIRLTEIRIKRISKFDIDKAQARIEALEGDIAQVKRIWTTLLTLPLIISPI